MQIRTVKQFVLHLESFRNIELWYQGIYYLKFTIYAQNDKLPKQKKSLAYPFAVTECNLAKKGTNSQLYDSQIVSHSFINKKESAYYTKGFHLKYFEEEIQINDVCHFRYEVDAFDAKKTSFVMEVGLWFYDSYKKDLSKEKNFKTQSKEVRNAKFIMKPFSESETMHEFIPILFEDQYFSQINLVVHAFDVDHKVRMNTLQLADFANLSYQDKKLLIDQLKNQKMQKRISISEHVRKQLKLQNDKQVLESIYKLLNFEIQTNRRIIDEYKELFEYSITENETKYFSEHLVYPNQIQNFGSLANDDAIKEQTESMLKYNEKQKIDQLQDKLISLFNKINYIGARNLKVWQMFIKLLKINPRFCVAYYEVNYRKNQQKFWNNLVRIDKIDSKDITSSYNKNLPLLSNPFVILVKQLQKNKNNLSFQTKIYEHKLMEKKLSLPLIVIQSFDPKQHDAKLRIQPGKSLEIESPKKFDGIHLIVLVHGFQGTSFDMKMIKNNISFLFPESMFLCCTANEDMTDKDIFEMGNRLAVQIKSYIIENFPNNTLGRISFIGHSLGGLKIRAALPKLLDYKDKFFVYISLSSPHLGYKVNTSSVVEAGIWILQKLKESECLKQLTMTDNSDPYETTLYRLSLQQGLQYFKKIMFYSSSQDSYAPYESARIQIDPAFMGTNDPLKNIHCQMVKNIFRNIRPESLNRVHVNFTINTKNLDSLIGRTAHIMFLQTAQIIKALVFTNQKLFS